MHIQVEACHLGIARGIGRIGIDPPLQLHQALQLVVHTFAYIAQILGGQPVLRIENKRLAIRLNRVLIKILRHIGIANILTQFVVIGRQLHC